MKFVNQYSFSLSLMNCRFQSREKISTGRNDNRFFYIIHFKTNKLWGHAVFLRKYDRKKKILFFSIFIFLSIPLLLRDGKRRMDYNSVQKFIFFLQPKKQKPKKCLVILSTGFKATHYTPTPSPFFFEMKIPSFQSLPSLCALLTLASRARGNQMYTLKYAALIDNIF